MTGKERIFCDEYVKNGGNVLAAAIAAGYGEQYAHKRSYQLLSKPHIAAEINRLRGRVNQIVERNSADVVNQLAKLAFSQILDFMKPDPAAPGRWICKTPDELTDDQRAAVAEVRVKEIKANDVVIGYEYKYRLHDQQTALIQMGRHFGIFDDKLKLVGSESNRFKHLTPEQLAEVRKSIVKYMERATATDGEIIDTKMLPDDSRH